MKIKILKNFIERIKIKNKLIEVRDVSVKYEKPTGEFTKFSKVISGTMVEVAERMDDAADHLEKLIGVSVDTNKKVDKMLEKQDKTIEVIEEFHKDTAKRFDIMEMNYGEISRNLVRAIESIERMLERSEKNSQDFRDTMKELAEAIRNRK